MYPELLGQNHFWHVLQTCPDLTNLTVRPARFFGVDFLLGTCASVYADRATRGCPPLRGIVHNFVGGGGQRNTTTQQLFSIGEEGAEWSGGRGREVAAAMGNEIPA